MHQIARTELALCWLAWMASMSRVRHTSHKPVATARTANWGVLLQTVSYIVAAASWHRTDLSVLDGAAMILGPVGVALMWSAVQHLGKQWRIQAGLFDDHELVRTGPYRFVRHPLYLSMLLMYLVTAFTLANLLLGSIGLILFIVGTEIRIRVEDSLLESRFGAQFSEYKEEVPAYLPFLR